MRRKRKEKAVVETKAGFQFENLSANHIAAGGLTLLIVLGFLQYMSPANRKIRRLKAEDRLNMATLQAQAAKANRRYRNKCSMAYRGIPDAQGYYHEILPLSEGQIIVSTDGRPLPDGQVVCDHLFMTFVIADGVTADGARATDAQAVIARFNDYAQWHPEARRGAIVEATKRN